MDAGTVEACFPFRDTLSVTWLDVDGTHDIETIRKLGECYGLHPLVQEDILNTDQRPKLEDYGDYLYIVLKMLSHDERSGEIRSEQVSLILGRSFVISFQEGKEGDVFGPIRERIRSGKGRIRKTGADFLAYSLIDAVVDSYFVIMEKLGESVDILEERLVDRPSPETLHGIHALKKEMIFLRKSVWPLREVIGALERGDSGLIQEPTRAYLRDVYDHTIQVIETIETFRDMVTGMLDIYLSSLSNRLNEVMKVLTIIATLFMPLTFLAGVYGMNFRRMPELEWPWGYPAVLGIMCIVAISMLAYFKKKKWF
jgi:magnesium transporter